MSSSAPTTDAARCHTRRCGCPSSTCASAAWVSSRCETLAAWWMAERTSGWRKRTALLVDVDELRGDRGAQVLEHRLASRRRAPPPPAPRRHTPPSSSAATSSSVRVAIGSPATRAANACSSRVVSGSQAGSSAASPSVGRGERQLDQRERIAGRVGQHALADRGREPRRACVEQRLGRRVVEPLQAQLRQTGVLERRVEAGAHSGQQDDRVGAEPARDEREHLGARGVQPVAVLDQQQVRARRSPPRRRGRAPPARSGSDRAPPPRSSRTLPGARRAAARAGRRRRPGSGAAAGAGPRTAGAPRTARRTPAAPASRARPHARRPR